MGNLGQESPPKTALLRTENHSAKSLPADVTEKSGGSTPKSPEGSGRCGPEAGQKARHRGVPGNAGTGGLGSRPGKSLGADGVVGDGALGHAGRARRLGVDGAYGAAGDGPSGQGRTTHPPEFMDGGRAGGRG